MSFHKRWDIELIKQQIMHCGVQVISSYNDGFTAWECKKDLYNLKFFIDKLLEDAPEFSCEAEYLKSIEQEKLIKILKK